jgi:SRSO17 transposase
MQRLLAVPTSFPVATAAGLVRAGHLALAELVRVAGTRWAAGECFQGAKNETGLDHYQVRRRWQRQSVRVQVLTAPRLRVCVR